MFILITNLIMSSKQYPKYLAMQRNNYLFRKLNIRENTIITMFKSFYFVIKFC